MFSPARINHLLKRIYFIHRNFTQKSEREKDQTN